MVKQVAHDRNRREQRFLAFGVDVLGLLLARVAEAGAGCSTLKVDSMSRLLPLHLFTCSPLLSPLPSSPLAFCSKVFEDRRSEQCWRLVWTLPIWREWVGLGILRMSPQFHSMEYWRRDRIITAQLGVGGWMSQDTRTISLMLQYDHEDMDGDDEWMKR